MPAGLRRRNWLPRCHGLREIGDLALVQCYLGGGSFSIGFLAALAQSQNPFIYQYFHRENRLVVGSLGGNQPVMRCGEPHPLYHFL